MRIDNLSKCCKPRQFGNFATDLRPNNKKVRYKHYEEMDNDTLSVVCLTRACNKAQSSGKTKLNKAIPAIVTGLVGTSIALAQPGKLASKAARGLGFLVLLGCVSAIFDKAGSIIGDAVKSHNEKSGDKNIDEKASAKIGVISGAVLGIGLTALVCLAPKYLNKFLNKDNAFAKFISSEKDKLANELNESKLGKFVETKINPFLEKHGKFTKALNGLIPVGIILGGSASSMVLEKSISNDIAENAIQEFKNAKLIQKEAREHFDSINAIEV